MKKITASLLFIFYFFINCAAQNWYWARSSGGSGTQEGQAEAIDPAGNVYAAGFFTPPALIIGTDTLYTAGISFFLIKYDPEGNTLWARNIDGNTTVNSIATDPFGNIYITGVYRSPTIVFGPDTLTSAGGTDEMFLAKYDSLGNAVWAVSAGGAGNEQGTGVATDALGNVYLAGGFTSSTIAFGPYTLTNSPQGNYDLFFVKYDASGQVQWAKSSKGTNTEYMFGNISADASGNMYATGFFSSDTVVFGPYALINASDPLAPYDIFYAKYNTNGDVLWAKRAGGTNYDIGYSIANDRSGNVFVTGRYYSLSIRFDSITLTNSYTGNANYPPAEFFVIKCDSTGKVLWAKTAGGQDDDAGYGVATDALGNAFVTGVYLSSSINLGGTILTRPAVQNDPLFIVKYDPSGNVLCAASLGSGGDDNGGLVLDTFGNAYIVQDFEGISPFTVGADQLTKQGNENFFIAKFACQSIVAVNVVATTTCQDAGSGKAKAIVLSGTAPYTYKWNTGPTTDTISGLTTGTYTVTVTDKTHATASASVTINTGTASTPPVLSAPDTLACSPDSVLISTSGTYRMYLWSNGDTTSNIYVSKSGLYRVTVTDANGCTAVSGEQNITSFPGPVPPQLSTDDSVLCANDSTRINTTGAFSAYRWNNDDTRDHTYASQAGGYWVTVTDANGCTAVSGHQQITVLPPPAVTITVIGDTLQSLNASTYQWYVNDTLISGATGALFIATHSGNYSVQITDSNNCQAVSNKRTVDITGITETGEPALLGIYPNPVNQTLLIKTNGTPVDIEAYDMTGRVLAIKKLTEPGTGTILLDVTAWNDGVYYLKASSHTTKLVQMVKVLCIHGQ